MSTDTVTAEAKIAEMLAASWKHYEHDSIKPGGRVRNSSEQYPEAYERGTAEVVAVMRKVGAWEQKYGVPNVEVLVRRDRDDSFGWWQDYRTEVVKAVQS